MVSPAFAGRPYAGVIIAAPFHSTGITLSPPTLASLIPKTSYVHLHVTLLATTAPYPNPTYFHLSPAAKTPKTILTTKSGGSGTGLEFNSLAYQRPIRKVQVDGTEIDEHVVKIFSSERVDDSWLAIMFGKGKVGWVYRHEASLFWINSHEKTLISVELVGCVSLPPTDCYVPACETRRRVVLC